MWSIWSLLMALLLLTSCAAAPPAELNDEDFLESEINPKHQSDQQQSLISELNDLRRNVTIAISAIDQQGEILKNAIDAMLKRIEPMESNTSKPVTEVNEKSCGVGSVCVKKGQCKSENININDRYTIQFRSHDNTCHYLETCCKKDDRIELPVGPEFPIDDDRLAACGERHIQSVEMTLDAAPVKDAEFGEFPWMVAIMLASEDEPEYIGGGSIIAPNVVLTSASKVQKSNLNELIVRAGDWDLKAESEIYPHVDRTVRQMILHDRLTRNYREYNIALLVLNMRFSSNPHIAPICLPSPSDSFDSSACIVTGWGKRRENSSDYSQVLKKVTVPILSRDTCDAQIGKHLKSSFVLDPTSICAGGEKGVDSCLGDGGSPLVCPIKGRPNRYYQVGIVAWGLSCGVENIPAIYTNVPHLHSWIDQELKNVNGDTPPIVFLMTKT
ncbi:hypothetical protein ACLKA7_003398 [Drosophila subpalustris]